MLRLVCQVGGATVKEGKAAKGGSRCRRIKQHLGLCISCCHVAISDSALPTSSRLLPVPSLPPSSFSHPFPPLASRLRKSQRIHRKPKTETANWEPYSPFTYIAAISVFCLQSSVCAYFYCANLAFDWGRPKSTGAWPGHVWLSLLWHYLCSGLDMTATVPAAPPFPIPSVALSSFLTLALFDFSGFVIAFVTL